MKKTVLILLLITSLFTINIQAADIEEWIWVYSDDHQSFYVDKNSVKYYKRQDAVSFLGKIETLQGSHTKRNYVLWFKNKTMALYSMINYTKRYGERVTVFQNPKPYYVPIDLEAKGFYKEKMVNVVCDALHKPPIWGATPHKWAWVYSTQTVNRSICDDVFEKIDPDTYVFFYLDQWDGDTGDVNLVEPFEILVKERKLRFANIGLVDPRRKPIDSALYDAAMTKVKEIEKR